MRNERTHSLIRCVPSDRLLTESDGPFVEYGERPIRPTEMPETLTMLGEIRKTDLPTLAEQVLGTYQRIQSSEESAREGRQRSLFKRN